MSNDSHSNVIELEDAIRLNGIAQAAGVSTDQARKILLGIVALPREQGDRIIERVRQFRQRTINGQIRRQEATDAAREAARNRGT